MDCDLNEGPIFLTQRKASVLECWVRDLGEQNNILVSTVEELEREAGRRVSLLQKELDKMAVATRDSCVSLRDHQMRVSQLTLNSIFASLPPPPHQRADATV